MRIIAQISDLHFGRHDPEVVDALLASLIERSPDLVVISGDFTQRARRSEFLEARRFLGRIARPKLVVPGNHDVPLYGLHRRFLAPFAKFNRFISPVGVPGAFFGDSEIAVLGLNTARRFTGKNGRVSLGQMAEIRRVFSGVRPGISKVLVTHHPLGSPSSKSPLELAGRSHMALQATAAAGVHILLSGHHHRASSGEIGIATTIESSILIVHAGTATSTRLRDADGNTYNLIRIGRNALTLTVMQYWPPHGFQESHTASYLLQGGSWRPE